MLAATVTPLLFFVADGLVLLEVLSLEDEDEEVDVEDEEDDDLDDVACSLALLMVELVVELVPDMVIFAMLPVPIVEFMLEPVVVELPEEAAAPVELLLDLDPEATPGVATALFELEEAVAETVEARAATALVGQVEHPSKSWSMPE